MTIAVVNLGAQVAVAAVAKVQSGPLVTSTSGTLTLTVSSATTATDLLVATLAYTGSSPNFSAPSGWVRGPNVASSLGGSEIWYYANNPGSITSAAFTYSGTGTAAGGELTEWSGVALVSPLDQTGTATATSASSVSVSSSAATATSGELAITAFTESFASSQNPTFTAGTGWTNLTKSATNGSGAFTTDYKLGPASGAVVSETESSSRSGTWAATIATFKPPCTGGSLTVTAPGSLTIPSVTLDGTDKQSTSSVALVATDNTGSGSGWNIQATSTTFTNVGGKTLPATASTITSASSSAATGNCSLPTNSVTYPVTVPAGTTPPTAVKVFNAAAATGSGAVNVTLATRLAVAANTFTGTYTSTWTFTIASGP